MTARELQKRNEKSQRLRVVQADDETYFVESSEGKIAYIVRFNGDEVSCSCGDYTRGIKTDESFRCKHVLSVFNSIPNGEVQKGYILERARPKLDERWITKIEGREFVKYPGLLDLGHQKGIAQIEVELLQLPASNNEYTAVCKATVVSKVGESFIDLGDANPTNCSAKVAKHILRMASTRAIARALRSFTNIGMTCLEELDLSDMPGTGAEAQKSKVVKAAERRPKSQHKKPGTVEPDPAPAGGEAPDGDGNGSGNGGDPGLQAQEPNQPEPTPEEDKAKGQGLQKVSQAQLRALNNLSRRRGITEADLKQMALDTYGVAVEELASRDASTLIRHLQTR
jgi:hypothetical protein